MVADLKDHPLSPDVSEDEKEEEEQEETATTAQKGANAEEKSAEEHQPEASKVVETEATGTVS